MVTVAREKMAGNPPLSPSLARSRSLSPPPFRPPSPPTLSPHWTSNPQPRIRSLCDTLWPSTPPPPFPLPQLASRSSPCPTPGDGSAHSARLEPAPLDLARGLDLGVHIGVQMVARTLEEYSQLAILLATRPSKLRSLRAQLLAQRGAAENPARANRALEHGRTGAVFDIPAWMDAYEQGLRLAVDVQTKRAKHFHILCKR
eukprot:321621-Rhodomonas_salina.1